MYFLVFIILMAADDNNIMISVVADDNAVALQNTGTVLFHKSDANKQCWTYDEKRLLVARKNMENLLPNPSLINFDHDDSFTVIRDYFRLTLDTVREETPTEVAKDFLLAAADTTGGYLKFYILPVARYAYYAGHSTFEEVSAIYELFDDLKTFLRSDGEGWREPESSSGVVFVIKPLAVPEAFNKAACDGLILPSVIPAVEKRARQADTTASPTTNDQTDNNPIEVFIPLPSLDSLDYPQILALPIKATPMVRLTAPGSAYVFMKYYIMAVQCMAAAHATQDSVAQFNAELYKWIANQVVPLLQKNELYPPFGGILRIIEDISAGGVDDNITSEHQNYDFIFGTVVGAVVGAIPSNVSLMQTRSHNLDEHPFQIITKIFSSSEVGALAKSHYFMLVFFFLPTLLVVFLCFLIYLCCNVKIDQSTQFGTESRNSKQSFTESLRQIFRRVSNDSNDRRSTAQEKPAAPLPQRTTPMLKSRAAAYQPPKTRTTPYTNAKGRISSTLMQRNRPSYHVLDLTEDQRVARTTKDHIDKSCLLAEKGDGWDPLPQGAMADTHRLLGKLDNNTSSFLELETSTDVENSDGSLSSGSQ